MIDEYKLQESKQKDIERMFLFADKIIQLGYELHSYRVDFVRSFGTDYKNLADKINKQGFDFTASGLAIPVSELLDGYIVSMSECLNTLIKMKCALEGARDVFDNNEGLKANNSNSKGNLTHGRKCHKDLSTGLDIEIYKQFNIFWSEYPCTANRKTALSRFIKVMTLKGKAEREAFGEYAGKTPAEKVAMMIKAFHRQFTDVTPVNIPQASKWLIGYCWRE